MNNRVTTPKHWLPGVEGELAIKEATNVCPNCKGTKEQVYHRSFVSFVDKCNFCNGTGTMDGFKKTFVSKLKK